MVNFISTTGEGTRFISNPGLLRRNSNIRDFMLGMNVGKYRLYNEALLPAIGEVANIDEHTGNVAAYAYESDNGLVDYYKTDKMRSFYFNGFDGFEPEIITFTQSTPNFSNDTVMSEDSLGSAKWINPWYNADSGYLNRATVKDTSGYSTGENGVNSVDNFFSDYKQRMLSELRDGCRYRTYTNGQISYAMHPEVDGRYNEVGNISSGAVSESEYHIEDGTLSGPKDIYAKTSQFFREKRISSIINRFYAPTSEQSQIQTAVSSYGLSRGRNLLKERPTTHNGYYNPYCRVWTSHYQYGRTTDTIRPFSTQDENGDKHFQSIGDIQGKYNYYRPNSGAERLEKFTVLQKNGLPRIAPSLDPDTIKKCMFSIENLAWKDLNLSAMTKSVTGEILGPTLTKEQIGPNGGRIMWFPPYDLTFSESSKPNWGSVSAIGRGEKIYMYTDTERSGSLSFSLLVDHPSVVNRLGPDNDAQGDAKESLEQKLLRFFAGCGNIEPNDTRLAQDGEKKQDNLTVTEPPLTPQAEARKNHYYCYIFFPNNFSGVNLAPGDAMKYLYSGAGVSNDNEDNGLAYDSSGSKGFPSGYEMSNVGISIFSGEKPSQGNATDLYYKNDLKAMISNGHGQYWGYLIDDTYKPEILSGRTDTIIGSWNYADRKSYKLNSNKEVVRDCFGLGEDDRLISFEEFYNLVNDMDSSDSLNRFKRQMGDDYVITVNGFASEHGHIKNNDSLHDNRAKTTAEWLWSFFDKEKVEYGENGTIDLSKGNDDVNLKESKAARCAKITISFNDSDVDIREADNSDIRMERSGSVNTQSMGRVSQTVTYDPITKGFYRANDLQQTIEKPGKITLEEKDVNTRIVEYQAELVSNGDLAYDNEYSYFRDLKENDPMVYDKIVDKLKYFNPAFHSITPEGFNARLTFLHQCTRQGPTQSHADGSGSASNLAFGRPPYCILRVGDFYNTKIAITSLDINYDDTLWDFNPEGVGVQPMMAKVTIHFTFVGGNDLSGPISRLQNAVSFNFYGNTSVYDRRADYRDVEIFKENNGKGNEDIATTTDSYYVWNPSKKVSGSGGSAGPQYKQYSVDYKS